MSVLSIDIETHVKTQTIRAVALSLQDPFREDPSAEQVLFLGPELNRPGIECFSDEKLLLETFRDRLIALDPDVITGRTPAWRISSPFDVGGRLREPGSSASV